MTNNYYGDSMNYGWFKINFDQPEYSKSKIVGIAMNTVKPQKDPIKIVIPFNPEVKIEASAPEDHEEYDRWDLI